MHTKVELIANVNVCTVSYFTDAYASLEGTINFFKKKWLEWNLHSVSFCKDAW